MKFLLPDDKTVLGMLSPLFTGDTTVSAAPGKDAATDWAAIYVDDAGSPVAACLCSKEFVAYAGAALMMLPAAVAKEAAASGQMDEVTVSSFHEIMNICSRLLMSDRTPHLRLGGVAPRGEVPALAAIVASGARKDFEVSVPRYGNGRLGCIVS